MSARSKLTLGVFICAAFMMASMGAYAADAAFVGNNTCKMCHNKKEEGEMWTVWQASKHAKALETLKTDAAKEVAKKAGVTAAPDQAPECLKCHVTGYDAAKDPKIPAKIDPANGVQCESCHGPASLHIPDGQARKMKKDMTVDIKAHIKKGDKTTCVTCHNDKSPTWKADRYTLADGSKSGFDYDQAWKKIAHNIPKEAGK